MRAPAIRQRFTEEEVVVVVDEEELSGDSLERLVVPFLTPEVFAFSLVTVTGGKWTFFFKFVL